MKTMLSSVLVGVTLGACGGANEPTPSTDAVAMNDVTALSDAITEGDDEAASEVEKKSQHGFRPIDNLDIPYVEAGQACPDFPIRAFGTGGRSIVREYTESDGDTIKVEAGKGHDLTLTRLEGPNEPPPTVVSSITLPGSWFVTHTITHPDKSEKVTAIGSNVIVLFPSDIPRGPTTTLHQGRIVYTISPPPDFQWVVLKKETHSKKTDICAALINASPT